MPSLSRMFRTKSRKSASNPHNLRIKNIAAAHSALTSLDALAHTLDASPAAPSAPLSSVDRLVSDIHRSTQALTAVLAAKHAPPSSPAATTTTTTTDLNPPRLRLPARNITPASATERRTFAEWTRDKALAPTPQRPISLPAPARAAPRTPSFFSTEAKTRKLRALQKSGSRASLASLDSWDDEAEGTPLGMDELMAFLRAGNSMRDL